MNTDTSVRRADDADIAAVLELVTQYWDFEAIAGFNADRVRASLQRLMSSPSVGAVWIAEHDNRAVGYLIAVYVFSLEHGGMTAEIDEFFVLPSLRDVGTGGLLLNAAEMEAVHQGCTNLSLQVSYENDRAKLFYRRHAYVERSGFHLMEKMLR